MNTDSNNELPVYEKYKQLFIKIISTDSTVTSIENDKVKCKVLTCNKIVKKTEMRIHIGIHIAKKEIEITSNLCGLCGDTKCAISLVITSGVGAYCNYGPSSNCSHFIKFNIGSCLKSKCTNRPVVCNECKCCYWSYNLLTHYNEAHKSIICPIVTSSNEFNLLEKL